MENPLPKTLLGSVQIEWKKCGKPTCRCRLGSLHGPYYARRWRDRGKQRKKYVPAIDLLSTLVAIEARHHSFPAASSMVAAIELAFRPSGRGGDGGHHGGQ